jgi:hypothetical protein
MCFFSFIQKFIPAACTAKEINIAVSLKLYGLAFLYLHTANRVSSHAGLLFA